MYIQDEALWKEVNRLFLFVKRAQGKHQTKEKMFYVRDNLFLSNKLLNQLFRTIMQRCSIKRSSWNNEFQIYSEFIFQQPNKI